jgi:hypothetical protein
VHGAHGRQAPAGPQLPPDAGRLTGSRLPHHTPPRIPRAAAGAGRRSRGGMRGQVGFRRSRA